MAPTKKSLLEENCLFFYLPYLLENEYFSFIRLTSLTFSSFNNSMQTRPSSKMDMTDRLWRWRYGRNREVCRGWDGFDVTLDLVVVVVDVDEALPPEG